MSTPTPDPVPSTISTKPSPGPIPALRLLPEVPGLVVKPTGATWAAAALRAGKRPLAATRTVGWSSAHDAQTALRLLAAHRSVTHPHGAPFSCQHRDRVARSLARDPIGSLAARTHDGRLVVAVDGSCDPVTGHGTWAWFVDADRHASGTAPGASSTLTELTAAVQAIEDLDHGALDVVSDCTTVVDWIARLRAGRPIPVRRGGHWPTLATLAERLAAALAGRDVTGTWVRGHHRHGHNLAADRLARSRLTVVRALDTLCPDGGIAADDPRADDPRADDPRADTRPLGPCTLATAPSLRAPAGTTRAAA